SIAAVTPRLLTKRVGERYGSPLKPNEGLNGPPKASVTDEEMEFSPPKPPLAPAQFCSLFRPRPHRLRRRHQFSISGDQLKRECLFREIYESRLTLDNLRYIVRYIEMEKKIMFEQEK